MVEKLRDLGIVKLVQLQPNGLIIERDGENYYDVTRRVEVDELIINLKGIEAITGDGEHALDIHHLDHFRDQKSAKLESDSLHISSILTTYIV